MAIFTIDPTLFLKDSQLVVALEVDGVAVAERNSRKDAILVAEFKVQRATQFRARVLRSLGSRPSPLRVYVAF